MNEIIGYKAFKTGLQNKYGQQFEKGVEYSKTTCLKFGVNGHGFHLCANLEDTFRYFNPTRGNVYCKVVGSGNFIKVSDYAYQAGDMYVTEKIKITEILSREEILAYALSCDVVSFNKMLALYCFNRDELEILKQFCINRQGEYLKCLETLSRFQTGDVQNFKRSRQYLYV